MTVEARGLTYRLYELECCCLCNGPGKEKLSKNRKTLKKEIKGEKIEGGRK
jgi:hypothetical protein